MDDSIRNGNGTSFSTPLFSGLVACLKQAHPLRTNFQIIDAILKNSHLAATPDNIYGYGIPNACKIDSALTVLDSVVLSTAELQKELKVSIYPNPASDFITLKSLELITEISLLSLDAKTLKKEFINSASIHYQVNVSALPKGIYFVLISSLDGRKIYKKLIVN